MPAYYHIMILPKPGVNPERIERKFNFALDWFRFSSSCWIVYTSKDAETWYSRLEEFVRPGGKLFICKLDVSDRQGFLPKAFWDWLKQGQRKRAGSEPGGP